MGEVGLKRNEKSAFIKTLLRTQGDAVDIAFFQKCNTAESPYTMYSKRLREFQVFGTKAVDQHKHDTAILVRKSLDRKSTRLNSSHRIASRMPSSA